MGEGVIAVVAVAVDQQRTAAQCPALGVAAGVVAIVAGFVDEQRIAEQGCGLAEAVSGAVVAAAPLAVPEQGIAEGCGRGAAGGCGRYVAVVAVLIEDQLNGMPLGDWGEAVFIAAAGVDQ